MTPNDVKQKRKTMRGGARHRRGEQGQRETRVAPERACAERRRGVAEAGVQPRPERAHDAHDDGDVEEDVREEDRPDRALGRVREEGEERGRDDDRRQHERHQHERLDERAAAEGEARERPGERQPGDERDAGRDGRLPEREPRDLERRPPGEHVPGEIEAVARPEAPLEDREQRPGEEDGEERDGDGREGGAQRTTISVHSSTQRSRFSSISSAGRPSGSSGTSACSTKAGGSSTPSRTG